MKLKIIFITLLGLWVLTTKAQVTFEAKLSKNKVGLNEKLRVEFVMNKDGDNFTPPSFKGFTIIMGPSQNIMNSYINGVKTFSKSYTYIIAPITKGKFTITQAEITIDGNTYKTAPKTVTVTAAVAKPSEKKTADNIADESVHLVAEISKSSPYLNEAITLKYILYIGSNISVTHYKTLNNPKYNHFWSQNISVNALTANTTLYNGKPYRSVVLKKVVLYPQKSGKLEIEPLVLDLSAEVPSNKRDFFGGRIYTPVNIQVSTVKTIINTRSLPEKNKPDNFSGAVGQFNFKVATSKSSLNAGESLQTRVEVSGKGNLKLLDIPKLIFPNALEVYDPEFEEEVRTTASGMRGKVLDNYTVVPSYQGKYTIPSVAFNYFDPKTNQYKTLTSKEILVNVIRGPKNNTTHFDENALSQNSKNQVTNTSSFKFLKLEPNLIPFSTQYFFNSNLFWSLLLLPLLAIPIAIFVGRKKAALANDEQGNKIRKANRLVKKYLSEAKKQLREEDQFYIALEKALHNYLKAKLRIETSDFSKKKIQDLLSNRGVEVSTTEDFIGLLKSCELARYSPSSSTTMQSDYQKAVKTISFLDKQI